MQKTQIYKYYAIQLKSFQSEAQIFLATFVCNFSKFITLKLATAFNGELKNKLSSRHKQWQR